MLTTNGVAKHGRNRVDLPNVIDQPLRELVANLVSGAKV